MFVINNFPMPPTVNQMYQNNFGKGRRGRRKSDKYKDFEKELTRWSILNKEKYVPIVEHVKDHEYWRVDCYFKFHAKRLFCKDGSVKTLDAHNRIKPTHDSLAKLIRLDDKHFFAGDCAKVPISEDENECVYIKIMKLEISDLKKKIQ